jgi:hypothetical protein
VRAFPAENCKRHRREATARFRAGFYPPRNVVWSLAGLVVILALTSHIARLLRLFKRKWWELLFVGARFSKTERPLLNLTITLSTIVV